MITIDKDDVMDISDAKGFKQIYDFKDYTHWRITEILRDCYNAYLEEMRYYKGGRYSGYRKKYRIRDIDTDEIIYENVYLDELRREFAKQDFPKVKPDTPERNKYAEKFLDAVANLQRVKE